jgi:hypothetical protein
MDKIQALKAAFKKLHYKYRGSKPSTIPEGYKWCSACEALTPHTKDKHWHYHCVICDNVEFGDCCPNCGCPAPEIEQSTQEVVLHHKGCHFGWEDVQDIGSYDQVLFVDFYDSLADRIANEFFEANFSTWMMNPSDPEFIRRTRIRKEVQKVTCSCPHVTIYLQPYIFNYVSYPVFSMDCYNAIDWSYDVRCKICGCIYGVTDGNC